ncbi:hypothetical protein [Thioclava sp. GXIMD4216]|uniref:17 kDa surface antigen n=1 Tax=Thioclava litoralis TaxID=3076557 RepID=A0ABZ1DXQ5_9RHOB|nr:hypothetical protein RPE78_09990 [Thioclava sp. FTW29]
MRKSALLIAILGATALAGCQNSGNGNFLSTDGGRALVGAGAGALVADATDNNVLAGAAIGAGAGALCDDAGVCSRSY